MENSIKHGQKHKKLTKAQRQETIAAWSAQIDVWLSDPFENPNPFMDPPASKYLFFPLTIYIHAKKSSQTIAEVRRQLAAEENELEWSSEISN